MGAPLFRANATWNSGTGSITTNFPAGYQVDDILVLIFETANNTGAGQSGLTSGTQTNLTTNGWARCANSNTSLLSPTVAASQNTLLDVWWNRATNTSQTAVSIGDTGDHTQCVMLAFSGAVKTGNPWDDAINVTMTTASAQTNSKNLITSTANTLIISVLSSPRDAAAAHINASPLLFGGSGDDTGLTELCDWGTTSGNGGTIGVLNHRKPSAGATANVRANTVTSNIVIWWTGALKGVKEQSHGYVSIG
jgi:hypothetical protein